MSRMISFWLLIAVIILLVIVFFRVMANFLLPLFLAVVLGVVFNPLHNWILTRVRGYRTLAAALTTISVLAIVLVPLGTFVTFAVLEAKNLTKRISGTQVSAQLIELRRQVGLDMPHAESIRAMEQQITSLVNRTMQATQLGGDLEYVSMDLFQLERKAQIFARELNLPWVDEVVTEMAHDALGVESWSRFANAVRNAQELMRDQPRDSDTTERLMRFVSAASDWFHRYKIESLGGGVRAAAVELVNPSPEEFAKYTSEIIEWLKSKAVAWGSATIEFSAKFLIGTVIMMISLFFFLYDGPNLFESIKALVPMDNDYLDELVHEFEQVSRAVVVASLVTATVQGLLAGVGYWFAGLDSLFLLTVLTTLFALIPFLGTPVVWIPCCLYIYFFEGRLAAAIVLGIYCLVVVSQIDNVIRPWLLHGQSKLHPLLALLSILGGVTLLGPIGILVGPMVVVFLQTLLKILQRVLIQLDQT
ncbi:MAG TPA: AI-2E family transporter [Pirellulaceae bacterium]|nr:AI-2E family transporter [Pirellulaceae bacterium]HMP68396.1 AI-2E family transporter [Pirellulaceae bacterium]